MPVEQFDAELREQYLGIGSTAGRHDVVLLPDPEPRSRIHTIISVDDHVVEPPDLFATRASSTYLDRMPRIVELDNGAQVWEFEGVRYANIGLSAVAGRAHNESDVEPARFDEMRAGCYDPAARVRDMDINGVAASLNFPSMIAGFAGLKFAKTSDPGLGLACVRAWNDWMMDEWHRPYPTRFIPAQIPYLADAAVAAEEIRTNAGRGFRAVSFVELPELAGLPSLHTGYWDPVMAACEETETVVCLHAGSSGTTHRSSTDAPSDSIAALFMVNAMMAAVDWLSSRIPVRYPRIKIAMSEGGIGWVPALLDRMDRNFEKNLFMDWSRGGTLADLLPSEVIRRNFWFCAIDEPLGFHMVELIGADNILVESDYPHSDSSWPDTQAVVDRQIRNLDRATQEAVTWRNASELFRHSTGI